MTLKATEGHTRWAIGRDVVGNRDCPHRARWRLVTPWFGVRLHHFVGAGEDPWPHNHPFSFVTIVLRGSYRDIDADGTVDELRAGSIRYRPSWHAHRIEGKGARTLVFSGPERQDWGYFTPEGFVSARKYRALHDYAPCEHAQA